jgi:Protein of unknown function (DUF2889)
VQLYERNINSTVRKIDDDHLVTEASLLDLNHSMRVALTIRLSTREIVDAEAVILRAPLRICDNTVALPKKLVGLKIGRGINSELFRVLGGGDGCTHLYELALNAVRLTFNVIIGMKVDWKEWISKSLTDDEFVRKASPFLKGACLPFHDPAGGKED